MANDGGEASTCEGRGLGFVMRLLTRSILSP